MLPHHLHRHRHQNYLLLAFGLFLALIFSRLPIFHTFIVSIEHFGYLSAFFAGILFSSTFTAPISTLILFSLAPDFNSFGIVSAAAIGTVLCDLLIYFTVRKKIDDEITPTYNHFLKASHLQHLVHTRYFAWTLPLIGAFIIVSPLPNELAISLFSVSKTPIEEFIFVALLSHTLVLSLLVFTASVLV